MKVLITGARGQVGQELVEAFEGHDVVATDRTTLDVGDRDSVLQAITGARPDAVVHAASMTNVDGCELAPDDAYRINALGARHVAQGARIVGAFVSMLSTDYVFPGTGESAYTEWHETGPISAYGRSKLGGERELDPGSTIVRSSWVCGRYGHNFVKTMLRSAGEPGRTVTVVDDQRGCPTIAADLAGMVRRLVVDRRPGLFHVTNQGAVTWYEFARAIFSAAGQDPDRVVAITTDQLDPPRPAPRPKNSVLDNAALRLSGLPLLPDFHEPLERLVQELMSA